MAIDPRSLSVLQMPPDMVVRAAGIWDTRVPFGPYLRLIKEVNRRYALSELSALKTKRSLEAGGDDQGAVRTYFVRRQGRTRRQHPDDRGPWAAYRRAFGRAEDGTWIQPSMLDVIDDLDGVLLLAREGAIIRHISLFESFLHCWMINFLLAKLETDVAWTADERKVASHLSPVHRPARPLGVTATLRAVPEAYDLLDNVPPFFKHPATRVVLTGRADLDLSARDALEFWIALRNLLVHRDGWVSSHFVARQASTWDKLFVDHGRVKPLRPGAPLPLLHDMVSSVGLSLYRSCLALNGLLAEVSQGRRGVLPPSDSPSSSRRRPPPLLADGDHAESVRWTNDPDFRIGLVPALADAS